MPRPSSTMSSPSLNDTLTALGLDWHYSDTGQPNLLYLIAAIDGVTCRQDKTLFSINLAPSRPQIELVDREAVTRAIPLSALLSCDPSVTDSHTLQLVHLSETKRESKLKRIPQATTHMLRLRFPSLDDAQDVSAILRACCYLASSSTSPPASFPLLSATIHGQLCLHKSYIDKQSSTSHLSWAKRYLLLFPNRLILYRSPSAPYPVNVLPLTVDDLDSHAVVGREKGKLVLNFGQGREVLVWKGCGVGSGASEELTRWMSAIATEQTASFRTPVSALFSPALIAALQAGRGLDERWLSQVSSAASSRRGSVTDALFPPPLPPLPPASIATAALTSVTTASSTSISPPVSHGGSFSAQFDGNPMLNGGSPAAYSPNASPPFNAAVFLSTLSSQSPPLLHIASNSASNSRDSSSAPPLSLAALLSSPRSFFHYLLHLSSLPLLFSSDLPTVTSFQRVTPQPLFKKRGKLMHAIDHALSAYHAAVTASTALLRDSRLVTIDEFEQSGSGQIGFAYPGFDEQVFDVGRLSVVGCGQLIAAGGVMGGGGLEFTRSDYLSAIESNSPAKELMQSSPDVGALYEGGEVAEAKALSKAAQRVMLHNCALAQHLKGRIGQSSRHMLAHNELVLWSAVLSTASATSLPNASVLQSFLPCAYITNPALATLQQMLALHSHTSSSFHVAAGSATPLNSSFVAQQFAFHASFSSAPVSPQGSPDSSPLSSQPGSPKATPGSHSRKGLAPAEDVAQQDERGVIRAELGDGVPGQVDPVQLDPVADDEGSTSVVQLRRGARGSAPGPRRVVRPK